MKRKLLSLISLMLVTVMLLLSGCAHGEPTDGGNESPDTQNQEPPTDQEQPEPVVDGAYLNGVELSKYSIIYSNEELDYNRRAAKYIQAQIEERTGLTLEVNEDDTIKEYEIVVGETERIISRKLDAETEDLEFAIMASGSKIALEADYFVIAAAAYFFVDTYVTGEDFSTSVPTEVMVREPIVKEAKNYILLIGDGMGLYQTLLYDYMTAPKRNDYSDGENEFYGYMLPYMGYARTNSLSGVTDSAAAGTALSTGYKTINGYVGKDSSLSDVTSITELAGYLGMATAVMSTEAQTGATPASFSAHANDRGQSAVITNSQNALTDKYGTIIDCNYNFYDEAGVTYIQKKVNDVLSELDKSELGFFLMYEEAHIDKHCHNNDINNTFLALIRFNQVIATFMEYAFYNPDTFVLITADHETGALLPNGRGTFSYGSGGHSAHYVPVFAYGMGGELFHDRVVENVQIPMTIVKMWGIDGFGDNKNYKPLF